MDSSLHDGMVKCVHRKRFLEVFLSPFSDFHDRIMPILNAWASNIDFAQRVSMNRLMILCSVDDDIVTYHIHI